MRPISNTYRPRRILTVLAALLLPAATCGVAPALQDLMQRMQRVERFVENAQLPPVLMDDHGIVIGRVLEYNDMMLYSSVVSWDSGSPPVFGETYTYEWSQSGAPATVLFEVPGHGPLVLEATENHLRPRRDAFAYYYYESLDCTGTQWTIAKEGGANSPFGHAQVGPPGRTLYAADYEAPSIVMVRAYSVTASTTIGMVRHCFPVDYEYPREMAPLRRVYDLDAFTLPFQIADQRELWLR